MPSFHSTFGAIALIAGAAANGAGYQPPRLVDGRPDFQGNWDHVDATPLERPPGFDTLVITAAQAAEIERGIERLEEDRATPTEPTEYFNERRIRPIGGELRSSVIIAPPNGRVPWTPRFGEWQKIARHGILNAMTAPSSVRTPSAASAIRLRRRRICSTRGPTCTRSCRRRTPSCSSRNG
jgi:hypothetical protein